jgi:hypothetical protein
MSQEAVVTILGVPVTYAQREILSSAVASSSFAGRYRLPTSRGSATTKCLGKRGLVEWVRLRPENTDSNRQPVAEGKHHGATDGDAVYDESLRSVRGERSAGAISAHRAPGLSHSLSFPGRASALPGEKFARVAMAYSEHPPIYKRAYDLCLYFEQIVRNFSRYHKPALSSASRIEGYSLGQDLRDGSRRILNLIVRANSRRDKLAVLLALREEVEELKVLLRLCQDAKALPSFNSFECLTSGSRLRQVMN